ncbi:MAG TPA: adenylate/guanylate cyclase domain-containing protein [Bryobacteraceae bacterium]|jgi:class 3 adenylate cyclase|nr:adenylate/guanylate cyclase domain-containing protein [Bryobacteraceae bacterium]
MADSVTVNVGPPRSVPEDYDEYYLQVVKICLRYACPVATAIYMGFFAWDLLFLSDTPSLLKTLAVRSIVSAIGMILWLLAPRIQSLTTMMFAISALYLIALLGLCVVLLVIPHGLIIGNSGFLLAVVAFCGMFCCRPLPAAIVGMVAVLGLIVTGIFAKLTPQENASGAIFLFSAVLLSWVFLVLLHRELRQKHAMTLALAAEKDQSETLLKEILPRYVIQRIRDGAENIAESLSEVNVVFIDMVGFTAMSHRLAPGHLVEILGEVFRSFDALSERHGVTKIKTIGDAYMAATGAPEPSHLSAINAAEFCFAAIRSVEEIAARTGIPIQVRVGLATGAAISGVLSLKRPAYDLWGETVNLAARMESTSQPGRVHIAETTYWRVKDKYACEQCGLIDVKGVGNIQTYFIQPKS